MDKSISIPNKHSPNFPDTGGREDKTDIHRDKKGKKKRGGVQKENILKTCSSGIFVSLSSSRREGTPTFKKMLNAAGGPAHFSLHMEVQTNPSEPQYSNFYCQRWMHFLPCRNQFCVLRKHPYIPGKNMGQFSLYCHWVPGLTFQKIQPEGRCRKQLCKGRSKQQHAGQLARDDLSLVF